EIFHDETHDHALSTGSAHRRNRHPATRSDAVARPPAGGRACRGKAHVERSRRNLNPVSHRAKRHFSEFAELTVDINDYYAGIRREMREPNVGTINCRPFLNSRW